MANYYVAKNGNNGWPGSEAQPWLTINYAETQVGSNDTVYIKAGTYSDGRINFSGVHSSGNECRFRAYASDTVIITTRMLVSGDWYIFDDLEFVTSSSSSYSEIEVSGDNNVFNNMYSHDYTGSRWEAGVYIINPASYNTFNNLVMLDGGMIYIPGIQQSTPTGNLFSGGEIGFTNGTGIRFGGEGNTVENMAIHDCGYGNDGGGGADDCDGIVTHGDNHTFRNLRIYNIFRRLASMHTDSIQWWDYAGNIIIEGCEIGSSRPGGISSDQGHIQMNGEYRNMQIINNVFMGTGGPYTFNHDAPNTFDADYCKINNNVFRGPERPRYDNYNQRYWEMRNNVIYWDGPDWEAGAGWFVDYNIYVNANESPWDGANTLDQVSDAGFVDDDISSGNNYGLDADWHLVAGSICIDRADSDAATTLDPEGNPRYDDPLVTNNGGGTYPYYDIGVYEYQGVGGPGEELLAGSSGGLCTASAVLDIVYVPGIQLIAGQTDGSSTAGASVTVTGSGGEVEATNLADTYIVASEQATNYGTWESLMVYRDITNIWCQASLIRFDFTDVPAGQQIDSADLGIFAYYDPEASVTIYARHLESTGQAFTEGGACWDTYNGSNVWDSGDFSDADITTVNQASAVTTGVDGHWMNWAIKDMVQHAYDNHSKILEIVLTTDTDNDAYYDFNSRDYVGENPYLTIGYSSVGGPVEVAGQADGGSTAGASVQILGDGELSATLLADTYVQANTPTLNYGNNVGIDVYRDVTNPFGRVIILRFDFTAIPGGATIDTAILGLWCYQDPADGQGLYARHLESVGNAFTEMGANWETYNGSNTWDAGDFSDSDMTTANQGVDVSTGVDDHWFYFSIKDMVQHAYDNHAQILEVAVTTDTNSEHRFYFDSDEAPGDDLPELEITYSGGEVLVELAGQSDGGSTVGAPIDISKGFDGNSDGVATVNGVISPIRGLAGASAGTSTVIALLKAIREIAGVSGGSSTAIALLGAIEKLAGATSGIATAGTTLNVTKELKGYAFSNSTAELGLEISRNLSGASNGLSTANGSVTETTQLSGSSAGIATVYNIPKLESVRNLTGSSNGVAAGGVTLQVTKELPGQTDGIAIVGGILSILKTFVGDAHGTAVVTATLRELQEFAGATDGLSSASSTVNITKKLIGFTVGISTVTGGSLITRSIGGSSVGSSTVSGLTKINKELAGASNGASTAGATIEESTLLGGTTIGSSTASTAIKIGKELGGTTNGTSNAIATLDEASWLLGNSAGTSTAAVIVEVSKKLSGATNGIALPTAFLDVIREIAGAAAGLSTSVGNAMITRNVIGTANGSSATNGNVMITRGVNGATGGSSTVAALTEILKTLGSLSAGTSIASATLEEKTKMSGTSNGMSNASINVNVTKELSGDSVGSSTSTATLLETTDLAGTTAGVSVVGAVLNIEKEIAGATAGGSTTTASIEEATLLNCGPVFGSSYCNETTIFCTRGLIGQADGLSTAQAALQERTRLQGSTAGSATVQANTIKTATFVGISNGVAATGAAVTALRELIGQTNGLSNVDNVLLKVDKELAGTSTGIATVGAFVGLICGVVGSTHGMAVIESIDLYRIRGVGGLAVGISTAGATTYVLFALSGGSNGIGVITIYNLAVGTVFTVTIPGTSTATLALGKIRYHQLGYCSTSRPKAKGRMIVIRPK